MTSPRAIIPAACAALLVAAALCPHPCGRGKVAAVAPQAGGQPSSSPSSSAFIVFAVQKYDESRVTIDPVAVVSRNGFSPTPGGVSSDDSPLAAREAREFIKDYYRPGRQFRLLFGGAEAGAVKVVKFEEPGCVGMEASVTVQSSARLGGRVQALATDSATLGRGSGTRRAPTEEERASALELARNVFRQKRVAAGRIAKMETDNLTAADLDGDGRHELIGSFTIMNEAGVEHAAFLVAEPKGAAHVAALGWYHHGDEATAQYRRLVDILDLDGDGTAEIVAQGLYYESHDYMIYKKQRGAWRVAYTGGGGGC